MTWQDFVFLAGSAFSIVVLAPTLRNSMAKVPLGTSLPSCLVGLVYGATFLSMGMTFSAVGSILTGVLWALIAAFRTPGDGLVALASRTFLRRDETDANRAAAPGSD
ncbi:hypothetical protein [Halegenticoccus tardaugens]|uniref:hypothetical protein n=1 Tax=Halegenticoccus tardaugens TaxID=2071624 RepID=UPI00100BB640|nr:hypothetical protein [Halegenticoccus tardaugens]